MKFSVAVATLVALVSVPEAAGLCEGCSTVAGMPTRMRSLARGHFIFGG